MLTHIWIMIKMKQGGKCRAFSQPKQEQGVLENDIYAGKCKGVLERSSRWANKGRGRGQQRSEEGHFAQKHLMPAQMQSGTG